MRKSCRRVHALFSPFDQQADPLSSAGSSTLRSSISRLRMAAHTSGNTAPTFHPLSVFSREPASPHKKGSSAAMLHQQSYSLATYRERVLRRLVMTARTGDHCWSIDAEIPKRIIAVIFLKRLPSLRKKNGQSIQAGPLDVASQINVLTTNPCSLSALNALVLRDGRFTRVAACPTPTRLRWIASLGHRVVDTSSGSMHNRTACREYRQTSQCFRRHDSLRIGTNEGAHGSLSRF